MKKKYFGTDGIRSQVGLGMMSPDQVLKLGWATGQVIKAQGGSKVLIGKDTRISGYMFESALEAGLIYAGVDVMLLGPMPTPAVAYLTQTFHADVGIVISASHNPHYDNGIKFFDANGAKISDDMELAIEAAFERSMTIESDPEHLASLGRAQRINDAAGRYIEFCKSTYHAPKKLDGLHLVVDCANGAGYHIAPHVFKELGARVTLLGVQPDGLNINQGCGATDLALLQKTVVEQNADLGLALDGDADRLMMVDRNGQVVDGDDLLYILATQAYTDQVGVVGTLMTNLGVENAIKQRGFEFVRAQVGDRYVKEVLKSRNWMLGAEGSGHILCLDKIGTGDGIVAALQVLAILQTQKVSIETLLSDLQKSFQKLINVRVAREFDLTLDNDLQQMIKDFESEYADQGRILIRKSGTEPLVRVMVEATEEKLAMEYAQKLAAHVEKAFS